MRKKDTRKTW